MATTLKTQEIPNTDLTVSRIGYGCLNMGGWDGNPIDAAVKSEATRLIQTACESGLTLFDHADLYCFGKSEAVFGQVLKDSPGLRDRIVIQTKCGQKFPPGWEAPQPSQSSLRGPYIVHAAEKSLERLQTDHLDILLLHVPVALMDPQEVAKAFDDLHRAGKVRYFGVSNHSPAQIELLRKTVRQPIVVNQIHVGLGHCDPIADGLELALELLTGEWDFKRYTAISGSGTLDYCRLHDIQIQAWSPMPLQIFKPAAEVTAEAAIGVQKLNELAKAKGASASAMALAWLLHHPAGIVPLIGTGKPDHIIDNCTADRISLNDQEWNELFAAWADIKSRRIPA